MGFKEKIREYWKENMEGNTKAISKALGAMLITIVTALSFPMVAVVSGNVADWGSFLSAMIWAIESFVVFFLATFFGTKQKEGE